MIYFNLILVLNVHVKILNERKLCPYACWYWIIEFVFRSVLTRVWAFGMLLHEFSLFMKTSFKYSPHFYKFAKRMSLIFTNCQNESRCQDLCCVKLTLFQRSLHRLIQIGVCLVPPSVQALVKTVFTLSIWYVAI